MVVLIDQNNSFYQRQGNGPGFVILFLLLFLFFSAGRRQIKMDPLQLLAQEVTSIHTHPKV